MTLHRRLPPPTKAEQARQDAARELGCNACRKQGCPQPNSTEIHHLTESGRTISQGHTVALCGWHHRGDLRGNATRYLMERWYGPSLELEPRQFYEQHGDNEALLTYQDALLYEKLGIVSPPAKVYRRERIAKPVVKRHKPGGVTSRPSKQVPRRESV